ncbi:MAG: molybdopterin synthase catalytic subunit MoaE [Pseudomonadales bacterium]
MSVSVQTENFDVAALYEALKVDAPRIGAIVTFTGLVREFNDDASVESLYLEHYPGMTERVLESLIEEAAKRWPIINAFIVHRVGELKPSDQIVFVGVNSAHRDAAFAAAEFLMDILKTKAPFWKKELGPEGSKWLDAKTSDDERATRWH